MMLFTHSIAFSPPCPFLIMLFITFSPASATLPVASKSFSADLKNTGLHVL